MPQYNTVDQIISALSTLKYGAYSDPEELAQAFSVGADLTEQISQKRLQGELVKTEHFLLRKLILEEVFFPVIRNLENDYFDFSGLSNRVREERIYFLGTAYSIRTFGGNIYNVEDVLHRDPTNNYFIDKNRLMTPEEFIAYLS